MAKNSDNQVQLDDIPVTLRRKGEGKVWTARINLPGKGKDGGRVEHSTETKKLSEAIPKANQLYGKLHHKVVDRREAPVSPKFEEVCAEFIKQCEGDVALFQKAMELGDKIELGDKEGTLMKPWRLSRIETTLNRHYLPHFKGERIDSLRTKAIKDHLKWRKRRHLKESPTAISYMRDDVSISYVPKVKGVTVETLRKERQDFRLLIQFCIDKGYLPENHFIHWPPLTGKMNRRKDLLPEEMKKLQQISIERILATASPERRFTRWQCHMRMMWIYLTGLRPQEVARLRYRDLKTFTDTDVIGEESVRPVLKPEHLKNPAHERTVVPLPGFADIVQMTMWPNSGYLGSDYIFRTPEGELATGADKVFKRLLKAAKINGGNVSGYSLYSLRHTFITERLYEEMDIGKLSRWTGTSITMIERYYNHVDSEEEMSAKKEEEKPKLYSPIIVPVPAAVHSGLEELLKVRGDDHVEGDWDPALEHEAFAKDHDELEAP